MFPRIAIDPGALAAFCRRHHIRRLGLFGSVLRNDFGPDSDVDVLYEFEAGHEPGWGVEDVVEELERIIGRPVDFVPFKYLNERLRGRVLAEARVVYERSEDEVVHGRKTA